MLLGWGELRCLQDVHKLVTFNYFRATKSYMSTTYDPGHAQERAPHGQVARPLRDGGIGPRGRDRVIGSVSHHRPEDVDPGRGPGRAHGRDDPGHRSDRD